MAESDVRLVRAEIGREDPPSDFAIEDMLTHHGGSVAAVALEVLKGRLADLLGEPASYSIEGIVSVNNSETISVLREKIGALESRVAVETRTNAGVGTGRLIRKGGGWGR